MLPEVFQPQWNLLFDWIPGVEPCSGGSCAIPFEGVVFYCLLGVLIGISIRETHRRVSRGPQASQTESTSHLRTDGGTIEDGTDDRTEGGAGELHWGEEEENSPPDGSDDDPSTAGVPDEDSDVEGDSADDSSATDDDSTDTGGSLISSLFPSGLVDNLRSMLGSDDQSEESRDRIADDPRVDDEALTITAEFDEILNERTKEALSDPDKDIQDVEEIDRSLPPELDGDTDPEELFCKVEQLHQRQIAPNRVEKGDTHYKVGEKYRRVLYAHKLPDVTPLAGFAEIIEDPSLHFDMTIHFHALDPQKTRKKVKNLYRNLDASVSAQVSSGDDLTAGDKALRKEKVKEIRDEMKQNNERPAKLTMYVCVSHKDEETLLEKVDKIRDEFRTEADVHLKTIERNQKKALQSVAPLGTDPVHEKTRDIDPSHIVLGRSFGAMIASLSQSSKFEPSGHEWGVHSVQGHPIVKDPFQSPRNYNMTVVGESGTGKSLNTKQLALSAKAANPETLIIMLDPLQGFVGLAEALDAKKVTVGGNQRINPMEIRKPPDEYIDSEAFDEDKDPLSAKVDDVMNFIQNYVARDPGLEFGAESQLLRSLVLASYRKQGISHDVSTHDNPSPTLQDVIELASHAKQEPEQWTIGAQDPETIQHQAEKIGTLLSQFAEGEQYENLGKRPEEDIFGDNDVIYLDLSQQESSGGSGTGVTGQLMFSTAYELCKQHSGPAIYIVDEARFLFREAESLDYLAQRVRHSRHYDTSIRFITQEMDDFFEFEQAEGIVHNSSFQVIHQSADVDGWGDHFDLKPQHRKFIKQAATGTQVDYSQALVRFPEADQWYPLTIELGDRMLSIADFDEQEDKFEDLPGRGEETVEMSPVERELVARIRNDATSHEAAMENILEDWEEPAWEMLTEERAKRCLERIAGGDHPRKAVYLEALDQVDWLISSTGGDRVADRVTTKLKDAIEESYKESYHIANNPEELKEHLGEGEVQMTDPDDDTEADSPPPRDGNQPIKGADSGQTTAGQGDD